MTPPGTTAQRGELSLALGGGGARGAYQVGVLRYIASRHPELEVPLLTGVSAGGINAAHLANHQGSFQEKVESLVELWSQLTVEQVFRVDYPSLLRGMFGWAAQLSIFGGRENVNEMRGLVDTAPLAKYLARALGCEAGALCGVARNIERGKLRALAMTTTSYATGRTVTWCQGRNVELWERSQRTSMLTEIGLEHVLASAALPLFFPAIQVGDRWYGDGGIRLHAPLAPSIHLGADHILAVSTRYGRQIAEAEIPTTTGYPPPAQVAGVLLNAVFLDLLDQDAAQLERTNELLACCDHQAPQGLRSINLLVLRPSVDLGKLARELEPSLPSLFRWMTRRLGTQRSDTNDLISLVMFQPDYLTRLIRLGEQDAQARAGEIEAFLERVRASAAD